MDGSDRLSSGTLDTPVVISLDRPVNEHGTFSMLLSSSCRLRRVASEPQTGRRISLAKRILSEVTLDYTPNLATKATKNTGALEPLLGLLKTSTDSEKLRIALDTFTFLIVDESNTRMALDLMAVDTLLNLVQRSSAYLLAPALETLVALAKKDDSVKLQCWHSDARHVILDQIHADVNLGLRIRLLAAVKNSAFVNTDGGPLLLAPQLVPTVSQLLHPSMDVHLLHQCVDFLKLALQAPGFERFPGWSECIFRLVPFLSGNCTVYATEACLNLLCALGDVPSFKDVLFAAGCLPPVLALLFDKQYKVACAASFVLSSLAEGGLSRDKLCEEPVLGLLLKVLKNQSSVDVHIGVLYTLSCLVSYNSLVAASLRQNCAATTLATLLQVAEDECASLGAQNLLQLLGSVAQVTAAPVKSSDIVAGEKDSCARQQLQYGDTLYAEVHSTPSF